MRLYKRRHGRTVQGNWCLRRRSPKWFSKGIFIGNEEELTVQDILSFHPILSLSPLHFFSISFSFPHKLLLASRFPFFSPYLPYLLSHLMFLSTVFYFHPSVSLFVHLFSIPCAFSCSSISSPVHRVFYSLPSQFILLSNIFFYCFPLSFLFIFFLHRFKLS